MAQLQSQKGLKGRSQCLVYKLCEETKPLGRLRKL